MDEFGKSEPQQVKAILNRMRTLVDGLWGAAASPDAVHRGYRDIEHVLSRQRPLLKRLEAFHKVYENMDPAQRSGQLGAADPLALPSPGSQP